MTQYIDINGKLPDKIYHISKALRLHFQIGGQAEEWMFKYLLICQPDVDAVFTKRMLVNEQRTRFYIVSTSSILSINVATGLFNG